MLMRILRGTFLCILTGLCLFSVSNAQAAGSYGTRTYEAHESISLSSSSTVAQAVDWLEDFIDREVGNAMEIATDLMELVTLNDGNAYALALLDPADRPTAADIADAYKSFEDASDLNSEIRYYYDRLIYLFNQNGADREQIMSGELSPVDVDRVKLEMAANDEETAALMTIVINTQANWKLQMEDVHDALDGLDTANEYITRIRNQAALVLADQAAAIAAAEALAGAEPVVDVISDKEIAVTVVQEDGKTRLANIRVTLNIKGQHGATVVTNSNGTAVFWIADFKPNDSGVASVEMSFDGTAAGYQRRELGVMQLSGGDVFNMVLHKDDGKPYIVKAAFDDADMLSVANGMYMTPKNNISHTVELKVETKGKAVNVKAWYWKSAVSWVTLFSENFAAGDTGARSVTRKWVQKGESGAFPEQKPIYLTITEGSGLGFEPEFNDSHEKEKTAFLGEITKQDEPASGKEESKEKTAKILGGFKFTLPSDWAVIGGAQVKIPLETGFDYEMELGKSFKLGYNYKVEKKKAEFWKSENLKEQKQRLKREADKNANILKSTANGVKNDYMEHKNERILGKASASVTPFLYVELDYNFKTNHGTGHINVGAILAFKLSLKNQFMVGPVPAFIGLDLKLGMTVGVTVGLMADIDNNGVPHNLDFTGKTRVFFKVRLDIAITVGAGLPRIAYVGIRGCGWINVDITLSEHSPTPVWQVGLRAQAVVKLLFFSKEWTFWQYIYPPASGTEPPLLAPELEGSLTSQTIALEEALAASNFGEPNATAAESDLIRQLPITGGDVRYVSVRDDLSYAFWIGRKSASSDQTRLLYYRFDPTSPLAGTMGEVVFGNRQDGLRYTYEFDVEEYQGNVYVAITSGNREITSLPGDSKKALEQMKAAQQDAHLFAGVWEASKDNPSMIEHTIIREYGSEMIYVPRIRAISVTGNVYYFAYGAINIHEYNGEYYYRIYTATSRLDQAHMLLSFNAADYTMPDFQLFNTGIEQLGYTLPLTMVLAQSKKVANHSELYFASDTMFYPEQKVPVTSLNFSTMSAPFWADRSDPKSTVGFLLVKNDPDDRVDSKGMNGTLCTLFISNLWNGNYSDFRNSITVKDMGISVSADGALPLSVHATSSQNQMYAYWVQGQPGAQQGSQNAYEDAYVIKACLIDMKSKLTSPAFTWIALEKKAEKLHIMPVKDLAKPVVGYYLTPGTDSQGKIVTYGIRKLSFQLQTGLRILAFATDNSAVAQGKDFGMFFRLENTGSLVVKGAAINVKAKKISGSGADEVLIKNIHIDMRDPQLSLVTHYDVLGGGSRTTQGAYTVYRIYDVNDAYNGNIIVTREYGPGSVDALEETEHFKGMLPGNIATFKTNVTNSPTAWKGQYALYAEIVGIEYTMELGSLESAEIGTVTRIDNIGGTDTFAVTNPASTAAATGLFGYGQPAPAPQSVQTNQSNNTALNDTLFVGDARYADNGYNNLWINAAAVWLNGEEYASVTLSNSANPASPLVTPLLLARVLNADGTYTATYSRPLATALSGGFTRTMLIPMRTLLGGSAYYEEVKLSVESVSEDDYYELDDVTNHDTLLLAASSFFVLQPEDQTVLHGETATFSAEALGFTGPYAYRWQVRYPNGDFEDVPGGDQPVLTMNDVQASQQGQVYWVMATDSTGRTIMSSTALLTVMVIPPDTGDAFSLPLWASILAVISAALFMLCRRIPFGKR